MSFRAQFRSPAWAGIQPQMPEQTLVDNKTTRCILEQVNIPNGQVLHLSMDRTDACFYRVKNAANDDLFIRIECLSAQEHHSKTEAVARWLNDRDVPSNACLKNYPIPFEDNKILYAFPYIDGRYLEPNLGDMRDLGHAVAKLHTVFKQHPDVDMFRAETQSWIAMIGDMRTRIQNGCKAGPNADRLQGIAQDKNLDFVMNDAVSCVCHGDLHSGNIMRDNNTNKIIFLDFEDVTHSFLPPVFEIARMIERIILIADISVQEKIDAGRALINAYKETAIFEGDLTIVLQSHNLRSLCLLAVMEESGIEIVASEWEKFFTLFDAANEAKEILKAIEAA